jgi:HlyD family secretion protein
VPIKTGISDGLSTEVLDGLNEGDRVVTGLLATQSTASRTTNPFGGMRRF